MIAYGGDFLPSWAGAISIDLLPAVLVLILCVVHANIRREHVPDALETTTVAQMLSALRIAKTVEQDVREVPQTAEAAGSAASSSIDETDENVTALAAARLGKKDDRRADR